tara:strand:+ start:984 stop:1289 length:306 start_codon:yes stop_codon:yes gene_type:complete
MVTSCTSHNNVEFLGFGGCPYTPELRSRLAEADPSINIIDVDLMVLDEGNPRLGWGAPTILVGGEDLFGLLASEYGSVSCRNLGDGLPSITEIRVALEARK